jgi:hypothetical protein
MQSDRIVLLALDEQGLPRPVRVDSITGRLLVNEADDSAWEGASYVVTQPESSLSNEKVLGTDIIMGGALAARPAASMAGRLYLATDDNGGTLYRDTGATWQAIVGGTAPAVSDTIAAGVISVGNSAPGTEIVAARATRKRVLIQGVETATIYVGPSGLTTANGFPLVGVTGFLPPVVVLETAAAVFGIVASGSQNVRYIEEYGP